jgi:hypothetical protein
MEKRKFRHNPERKKGARGFSEEKRSPGIRQLITYPCLIIFILFAALGAGTLKQGSGEMEVTGKVYIMGNEPFTQVAIETKDGEVYVLLGEQAKDLRRLQGRRVSVVGKPSEEKPRGAKALEVKSYEVLKEQ